MARGDTYERFFEDKLERLGAIEGRVMNDRENVRLLVEHINASTALTLAIMGVVEKLADKEEDKPVIGDGPSIRIIQRKIGDWSRRTFPNSTVNSTMRHLWKEVAELDQAIDGKKNENICEEAADVFILLVQLCNRAGIDLEASVREKHEENLNRQWGAPDEYGVVYHKKESK